MARAGPHPSRCQRGEAHMVDVSAKAVTARTAIAEGYVRHDGRRRWR